jgi:hypothetical protein
MFYAASGQDRAIELTDLPQMDTGAPDPRIVATGGLLAISYATNVGRTELSFTRPFAHYMGPPNDELLHTHPLYERGLRFYAGFEVVNSSWLAEAQARSRRHPQHVDAAWAGRRHFVITFHDETFECLAKGYVVER